VTLKMLTEDEVNRIFGKLDCLLPLHEDLLGHLISSRAENGRTEAIGHVFVDWVRLICLIAPIPGSEFSKAS